MTCSYFRLPPITSVSISFVATASIDLGDVASANQFARLARTMPVDCERCLLTTTPLLLCLWTSSPINFSHCVGTCCFRF